MDMRAISKFMSYVLRHNPGDAGLEMDQQGWVDAHDLVVAIRERFGDFSHDDLDTIVVSSDKQRFQLIDGRIRANQGHSVSVNLDLPVMTPPAVLYHGTKLDYLPSIMANGLNKASRHHVHLSATIDIAEIVAKRRKGASVILQINTAEMPGPFHLSENGVWLVDYVAPEYISQLS